MSYKAIKEKIDYIKIKLLALMNHQQEKKPIKLQTICLTSTQTI